MKKTNGQWKSSYISYVSCLLPFFLWSQKSTMNTTSIVRFAVDSVESSEVYSVARLKNSNSMSHTISLMSLISFVHSHLHFIFAFETRLS